MLCSAPALHVNSPVDTMPALIANFRTRTVRGGCSHGQCGNIDILGVAYIAPAPQAHRRI